MAGSLYKDKLDTRSVGPTYIKGQWKGGARDY